MSRDKIYVSGVCNGFYAVKGTIKNNGIVFDFSTDTLYWVDESALKVRFSYNIYLLVFIDFIVRS